MSKPSAVESLDVDISRSSCQHPREDALVLLGAIVDAQIAYEDLVQAILDSTDLGRRDNTVARHQKVLLDPSTHPILQIIWKESHFITEEALVAAGMERMFSELDPMNCNGLATRLADGAPDLGRTSKWIRTILDAGVAYGLIVRKKAGQRVEIRCTDRLDQLMIDLSSALRDVYQSALSRTTTGAQI